MKKVGLFFAKVMGVFAGLALANFAGVGVRCVKSMRKMDKHKDKKNMMHSLALNSGKFTVEPDVDNAFLTAMTGKLKAVIEEQPKGREINVDLFAVFSNVTLVIPDNANVIFDGIGVCMNVNDVRTDKDVEKTFTVRINRKCYFTNLTVKE